MKTNHWRRHTGTSATVGNSDNFCGTTTNLQSYRPITCEGCRVC